MSQDSKTFFTNSYKSDFLSRPSVGYKQLFFLNIWTKIEKPYEDSITKSNVFVNTQI